MTAPSPVCGRISCSFFDISRLFVVCCPVHGERVTVQFASLTPFVSATKSEDVTYVEYAQPSYNSLSHDRDRRFLVRWQARDLFMPSQLDEQVATSHVVLTVLPKEDADFTDVKAHGPFQEWHCRFGTRFIVPACWQDWPRVIHLSRCRLRTLILRLSSFGHRFIVAPLDGFRVSQVAITAR